MNTTRARENRAHVRELLRERQPALAVLLNAAPAMPCGPGCRAHRWCECALDPERRFHAEDCPVDPGGRLRFTGSEMLARLGLERTA
jgi:hypothetical protein